VLFLVDCVCNCVVMFVITVTHARWTKVTTPAIELVTWLHSAVGRVVTFDVPNSTVFFRLFGL